MEAAVRGARRNSKECIAILKEAIISRNHGLINDLFEILEYSRLSNIVNMPVDNDNTTLLHLSVKDEETTVTQLLIDRGANINHQNNDGIAPLHVAAMNGAIESIIVLLNNGASPLLEDADGMTALDYAEDENEIECLKCLSEQVTFEDDDYLNTSVCEAYVSLMTAEIGNLARQEKSICNSLSTLTLVEDCDSTCTCNTKDNPTESNGKEGVSKLEKGGCEYLADKCASNEQKSFQELSYLTNSQLREKLIGYGERPGPINDHTRGAYLSYLHKIVKGLQPAGNKGYKGFRYELSLCLNGVLPIPSLCEEEAKIFTEFRAAGQDKSFFNYMLLDPKVLPNSAVSFSYFVEAIFYVGKGKNSRSFQHLKDAKEKSCQQSSKVRRILSIWKEGHGVIDLHVFLNISSKEAYSREAAIIDCIGLENLTNAVKGHYHGSIVEWSFTQKHQFGIHLLYRAYQVFLLEMPQQLFPQDI